MERKIGRVSKLTGLSPYGLSRLWRLIGSRFDPSRIGLLRWRGVA